MSYEPGNLTEKNMAQAVAYVTDKYCIPSDDNIETDADSKLSDFAPGAAGVWVKAWLFCPKEEL